MKSKGVDEVKRGKDKRFKKKTLRERIIDLYIF